MVELIPLSKFWSWVIVIVLIAGFAVLFRWHRRRKLNKERTHHIVLLPGLPFKYLNIVQFSFI